MRCMSCGAELPDGISFCTSCGAKVVPAAPEQQPAYNQNQMYQGYGAPGQPYPQQQMPMMMNTMEDTTPITPWGYIGYMILFAIPLVGIIMLFVYGFGSNTNVNLKNFSRAYLLIFLISIILSVVLGIIVGALGSSVANSMSSYYLIGLF